MVVTRRTTGLAVALALAACTQNVPQVPDSGAASTAPAGAVTPSPAGASTGTPAGSSTPAGTTPGGSGGRVAGNPFVGAQMYVPADYAAAIAANAEAAAAANPAEAKSVAAMKAFPTGVWLDRVAAIAGGTANAGRLGLTGHLDAALAQAQTAGKPVAIVFVVYNLPNRDCKSAASNGELMGAAGMTTYKGQYIDAIAKALTAKPDYTKLRVVLVIEPDSLPNMVTNATSVPACQVVASNNFYTDGITYALKAFAPLSHVSMYLDIAHSGWLGWDNKRPDAVTLYTSVIKASGAGAAVRGLATNIANYTPVQETGQSPSDTAAVNGPFYQFNKIFDELTFVRTLASEFAAAGLPNLGFIIDTSRNGWPTPTPGQPQDRRLARGNWCNIKGTGIGPRPQAAPGLDPALDAFVWVKPPGESDGYGKLQNPGNVPDAEGKRFDPDCDATAAAHTDSMPLAPAAGHWFNDHFMLLVRGAQPPL